MVKCQACLKSGKLTLGCRLSAGISCSLLVGVAGEGLVAKSFTLVAAVGSSRIQEAIPIREEVLRAQTVLKVTVELRSIKPV